MFRLEKIGASLVNHIQLHTNIEPFSKRPLLFDALRHRLLFALFLYAIIYLLIFPLVGRDAGALVVLPVALAATYYGPWGGVVMGLLSLPMNSAFFFLGDPLGALSFTFNPSAIVGTIAVVGLGYGVGRISKLSRQLQEEVNERKRAQADLELAYADLANQAQRSAEARNYFLTAVSHELRTPLNAVIGASVLLMDAELSPEQADLAQTVHKGGLDTVQIINTILDFTKVSSGAMKLNSTEFNLLTCIDKIINRLIQPATAKGLELTYAVSPDVPALIVGDADRLTYILSTLLNNALAFTERGSISIAVSMAKQALTQEEAAARLNNAMPESELLEFVVSDTGIGIRKESIDHIFEPFEREVATTQTYHAIGVGLALCRSLCQLMGGEMWVTSQPGVGSEFHFTIRASRSMQLPDELCLLQKLVHKTVLVVGEHEVVQENIASVLCRGNLRTIGVDCLESARQVLECGANLDLIIIADEILYAQKTVSYVDFIELLHIDPTVPLILLVDTIKHEAKSMPPAECIDNVLLLPIQWHRCADVVTKAMQRHRRPNLLNMGQLNRSGERSYFDEEFATKMPLRILMAEDNPVNAKVATRILERFGYHIDNVANGQEALDAVRRGNYDVILMDIQMPVMDGITATKAIRNLGKGFKQPYIIALTADTTLEEQALHKSYGIDYYTGKPISVDVVRSALETAYHALADNRVNSPIDEPDAERMLPAPLV